MGAGFPDPGPVDITNWDFFDQKRRDGSFSLGTVALGAASATNPQAAPFSVKEWDYGDNLVSVAGPPVRYAWKAPYDALVFFDWLVTLAGPGATNYGEPVLRKNGADKKFSTLVAPVVGLNFMPGSTLEKVKAGDTYEMWVYISSTAGVNYSTGANCYFQGFVVARL